MVLQVHPIRRQPFLFLPLEDLEQPLLLGHPGSGPENLTLGIRICSLLFKWSNSRYTVILWNTRTCKHFLVCIFYCLSWAHHATFVHSSFWGRDVKGSQLSNPTALVRILAPLVSWHWQARSLNVIQLDFFMYKTKRYHILVLAHGRHWIYFNDLLAVYFLLALPPVPYPLTCHLAFILCPLLISEITGKVFQVKENKYAASGC